jgi:NADPH-dependent 2,4-dienoyl-CoA reductase/sulfur reductase-like enzyme
VADGRCLQKVAEACRRLQRSRGALASKKRRLVKGGFYIGLLVASIPKKTFELFEKGSDEFWKGMLRL